MRTVPSLPRWRGPAWPTPFFSLTASIAAVATLQLGACRNHCSVDDGCFAQCASDDDCGSGEVCLTTLRDPRPSCTRPCSGQADCGADSVCRCLAGATSGFCDRAPVGISPLALLGERCAVDFTAKDACAQLCDCSCSYHDECAGNTTLSDCLVGCEGAYTAFEGCRAALDAYYACAQRGAVCVHDFTLTSEQINACRHSTPDCFDKAPEDACPDERADLEQCTAASWAWFFPVASAP